MAAAMAWEHPAVFFVLLLASCCAAVEDSDGSPSAVLTLDASNFSEAVAKHPFVVVEFYAPWCKHCKELAPEYEKAATVLSKNNPPIMLAKIDASNGINKELVGQYGVKGFPTLKILRNEGKSIQDYKGPRDADGIVNYLKQQAGPPSAEIKHSEEANALIGDKKIFIVGVFPTYSGEEFANFIIVAEKLRGEYDFGHTQDAELLPHGKTSLKQPFVRLFKPFDELSVDFQDFQVDVLENFIETASVPIITTYNKDPDNHPYVVKFFKNPNAKAMLFLNFSCDNINLFKSKYQEVVQEFKGKDISFLIGDLDASRGALQYFGLIEDQSPLIIIQNSDSVKYFKSKVEPDEIAIWLKEYMDGSLTPFRKSEPIPEVNNEPVKVVVADNFDDVVLNSGKNVLIEFYAPWCGHCKKLAPVLNEVALSFKDDTDVIIAKMDATANDITNDFDVRGYPTLYFSAGNKLVKYDGGRTADEIIDFIRTHRDSTIQLETTKNVKDEL